MKLHIFGASASGVTTLGEALAEKLNLDYFDSDAYFWEETEPPFTIKRNPEERNTRISKALNDSKNFILGGSVIHWGENVFPVFDLIVFLHLPNEIRMQRLKNRELERYGDLIYTDPLRKEKYEEFVKWAHDYDFDTGIANRTLNAHKSWLEKTDSPVLELIGDIPVSEKIITIISKLKEKNLIPEQHRY